MKRDDGVRQNPFESLSGEPVDDLSTGVVPAALRRPPKTGSRKTSVRPAEKRRRPRMLHVTFSSSDIPNRLRSLAERWNLFTAAGYPNHSTVVEYLLLSRLEAAERGEIAPPPAGQNELERGEPGGGQWF